jgi:transposase
VRIWCGIDWSERHHDVALVADDGVLVAKRRVAESATGFRELLELLAERSMRSDAPIPVAIETAKGLLPAALRAAGHQVFAINPLAVSRYRDRYAVSRAKSDSGDALVPANILRTDLAAHRPIPHDSELAATIRVLARAQQDAVQVAAGTMCQGQVEEPHRGRDPYCTAEQSHFDPEEPLPVRPRAAEVGEPAPAPELVGITKSA